MQSIPLEVSSPSTTPFVGIQAGLRSPPIPTDVSSPFHRHPTFLNILPFPPGPLFSMNYPHLIPRSRSLRGNRRSLAFFPVCASASIAAFPSGYLYLAHTGPYLRAWTALCLPDSPPFLLVTRAPLSLSDDFPVLIGRLPTLSLASSHLPS